MPSNPRASTDEETAPLLDDDRRDDSFFSALFHPSRPLTNLEKVLAGGSVLLLLLTATFVGLFAGAESALRHKGGNGGSVTTTVEATRTSTIGASPTGSPSTTVCLTPDCILLSASILQYLNTSVDPCEDFYEYAVGGWQATHTIPADRSRMGAFTDVDDANKKVLLEIISQIPDKLPASPSVDEENLHKMKSTFTSCMDVDKLNEVGLAPLEPMTDLIVDEFAPFDLVPAPDADVADLNDESAEWRGAWQEDYTLPSELKDAAERKAVLENLRHKASAVWNKDIFAPVAILEETQEPEVDEARRNKLTKTIAWLHSRSVDALFGFDVEGDAGGDDPQIQSLWFGQTSGGLPSKEYYEEKPIMDLYHSVVKGILVDIASHSHAGAKRGLVEDLIGEMAVEAQKGGWPWPWPGDGDGDDKGGDKEPGEGDDKGKKGELSLEDRMERLAGKVVAFERELIRAGADPEYLENPRYAYNPYTTEKVAKHLPIVDLPLYFSTFALRSFPENITVTHPPYLKSVTNLVDTTPDYVLSGYFTLRLAMTYASALGSDVGVRAEYRRLTEVLGGIKKGTKEVRQDTCLKWVDSTVGYIAGREFVRERFSPEAKEDAEGIIRAVIKAFNDKLTQISWMDEESAKAAQKKANAIIPRVGYPLAPNTTDPESLARYYRSVDIESDDFFGNVLRSRLADEARTWASLGKARDRNSWLMYPQTVNAYYNPPDSEITFPAGILQPPFYSYEWPSNLKYGAFGAVAAHELTHAFDNSGSQYDEKGRLRDWWSPETVKNFEERAQCIARQYSKYYVLDPDGKKVYVNGNLTNGEDIGDSGLAQTYTAWKNSLSPNQAQLRLPGLNYTEDQLFFLSFARVWAEIVRPASAVSRVRTDPHSPDYWRATGTLINLDAFHKAFQCKSGSRMNPPKSQQCELW